MSFVLGKIINKISKVFKDKKLQWVAHQWFKWMADWNYFCSGIWAKDLNHESLLGRNSGRFLRNTGFQIGLFTSFGLNFLLWGQ
jgi:hypothetical protein